MDDVLSSGAHTASQRQAKTRAIIGVTLAALLLGVVGAWLLARSAGFSASDLFQVRNAEQVAVQRPQGLAAVGTRPLPTTAAEAQQVEQMVEQQGGLDQRVAAMEQRMSQLDLQTQAAAGNAARAEGLLITFAARRSLERGAELGVLGDQLRLRFGDAQPNAVRTVLRAARDPVTLDQLIARLDGLAPELAEAPPREGPASWVWRELGELFVVRRENSPSPAPERRLERARLFLESGRADAAVAEVKNLPNAAGARDWITDASRYADGQQALETLELAAIFEPRELRDGSGNNVQQLSPMAR